MAPLLRLDVIYRRFTSFRVFFLLLFFLLFTLSQPISAGKLKDFFTRLSGKKAGDDVDLKKFSFEHGSFERSYYIHSPLGWNGKDPLPVVLIFHGGGGNARQVVENSRIAEISDKEKFLLIAPEGTGFFAEKLHTWNVFFGFGYAQKNKVDDLGFVKMLIEKIEKDFPINSKMIFATGISNGGIFCHWLAAQPWNKVAAIAPIVGCLGGKEKENDPMQIPPAPATPVSVMAINGLLDDHIPLEGGLQRKSIQEPRFISSASETVLFWIKANGCKPESVTTNEENRKATKTIWTGGRNETEVVQYFILNQGHAWPGAKAARKIADLPSPDFQANEILWEFFRNHPRRE